MSVIFRQCKNRLKRNSSSNNIPSLDNEVKIDRRQINKKNIEFFSFFSIFQGKNIFSIVEKLVQHYQSFETRFHQLEERVKYENDRFPTKNLLFSVNVG